MYKAWPKKKKKTSRTEGHRRTLEEMDYWSLIHIADEEFSFNLRAGAAVAQGSPFVRCYTCGAIAHWKEMDCGHYEQRDQMGTRYDYRNVRVQCHTCNRMREGEKSRFGEYLRRDGVDVEAVATLALFWGKTHLPTETLIAMIKDLRKENKGIRDKLRDFTE